jgi:hypothetical protein|uniref:Uncharacterized protein n=1 Tax=viral metagenome TaxID=1070528 RepID=A0A6C0LZI3_9ZZZZ
MGNLCYKDNSSDYSLLNENKTNNIDNMQALINKLTIGVKNLEDDVKSLENDNTRLKKINQTLLSRVVEQRE